MQESSGRELAGWSKEWLETAGVNTLRPDYQCDSDGVLTEFAVLQTAPRDHPVLRSHRIAVGLYDRTGGGLRRRARSRPTSPASGPCSPSWRASAGRIWCWSTTTTSTYAKIRLDQHSLATLISGIGEFTESLPAALCWAAAWDMCRDAEMAARTISGWC